MQEGTYRNWLVSQDYDSGTITAQLHRASRVERHYGDLDDHYKSDKLKSVLQTLVFSAEDERRMRPNPSKIPLDATANIRNNLASYRNAIDRYVKFLENGHAYHSEVDNEIAVAVPIADEIEDTLQKIGLERDMQMALRKNISELETGLKIIDGGVERTVESGRIDIMAEAGDGALVVIELKAGACGQRAIAQILSYMGDIANEYPQRNVRGLLVAAEFDMKAKAAVRMVPALELVLYGVRFHFSRVS